MSRSDAAVFTTADAIEQGWTPSGLRHAVRQRRLVRVRRGVYARPVADLVAVRAAVAQYPHVVISHRAALLVHGLPLVGAGPQRPEVTVPPRANANLVGVHVHRARLRAHDLCVVDDLIVTSVARTLCDVARHRPTAAAVAAIDHALHHRLVTYEELADVLDYCRVWPRIRRARRAVALTDERAESPLESVSRLTISWLGLPAPEPQVRMYSLEGWFLGRSDFYWDEFGVVGEADGRAKYDDRDVLTAEKDRHEGLEDSGLEVTRWGWSHTTWQRHALRTKIVNALERGRRRDVSGVARSWAAKPTPRACFLDPRR